MNNEGFAGRGALDAPEASERRFRAIFETAAIGIATVTMDGVIREANAAFERMLGHAPGGLRGKTVPEITHPDDPAEAVDLFDELLRGERDSYQVEKLYVRRDGSAVWGRVSASSVRDEAGTPAFIVAAIEDIDAGRAAEQQLRETEERYRTLVEELPLVTYIDALDDCSSNLYTSPQVERLLGYTAEEWQSDPDLFVRLLHPDDRERVLREVATANRTGERFVSEYRLIARDGHTVWFRDECVVARDADGAPLYSQGYLLDITERRQAEEELRESEARFRSMADDAPVLIWTANPDGEVTFVSKTWLDFTGASLKETIGKGWIDAVHPDDRGIAVDDYVAAVDAHGSYEAEYRLRRADGEYRWIVDHGGPHYLSDGTLAGYVGVGVDVTEEKEARSALERRERILEAVAAIAGDLVAKPSWEDVDLVGRLGEAVGASRAHVTQIAMGEGGVRLVHRAEWAAPGIDPSLRSEAFETMLAVKPSPLRRWFDVFRAGGVIRGPARELPPQEHRALQRAGVQSVLVVPVSADERIWGTLGFDDCEQERLWTDAEVDALKAGAGVLGAAISRQSAVQSLRETTTTLEAIVENSPLAIVWSDREGLVTGWNPAAERVFGWTYEEVVGAPPPHFVPGDDEGQASRELAEQGELVTDAEAKRRTKEGDVIDVRYAKAPLRDAEGEIAGTLAILTDVSERKRAEAALEDSEARFAAFMDNVKAGAYMKDEEGRYVYVNGHLQRVIGLPLSEILGKSDRDLFGEKRARVYAESDAAALAAGEPVEKLEHEIRADGAEEYYLGLKFPFRDADGRLYVGGVAIDVTEREQAEAALRETSLALEAIVDSSPLAIVTFDRNGCVTRWNGAAERMFGWSADEVLGCVNPTIPPGEEDAFRETLARALAGSSWRDVERQRVHKDGTVLDVSASAAPLRDGKGETIGMVALLTDVTERKRVAAQLLETKQTLESIIDNAPLAIITYDPEGNVTSWNGTAEEIFGWTADEALGRFNPTVAPGEENHFRETVAFATQGNSRRNTERPAIRKDGTPIDIRASVAPLRDATGDSVGMVAMVADITDRKRAERRLGAQHSVSAVLAESATLEEAGPRIVEELCNGLGWDVGCIWTVNRHDGVLEPAAVWHDSAADAGTFVEETRGTEVLPGEGSVGRAWKAGTSVWSSDLEHDLGPRGASAVQAGLCAGLAVPFESGEESRGVVELLSCEPTEPDSELLEILASTGRQLGQFVRRVEADAAVREREERFRTLVANVPGTIYRCAHDADWTMAFMSEAIREISGYPASDFIGNAKRAYADIIHPEDRDDVAERVAEAVAAREPFTLEYRIVTDRGEVRWVSEKGQPIIGAGDRVLWLDGAIFDVTEQRRVQSDLTQAMGLLDSVVESLPLMLFLKDADDLRFVRVNRAMEEVMGAGREELVGKSDYDLLPAEQASFFQQKDREVLATGKLVDIAEEPLEDRYLHTRKVPIFDEQGTPRYLLGISMDITEAKLATLDRERLLGQLEEQNEQLRQLDRMKDEFIALVSHELRTPLTSILGYLELVLEGDVGEINEEQDHFLRIIERNSGRLLRLVGDLLFVAQIEAGKLALERQDVDLAELARHCVEAARPRATEKEIELVLEGDAGPAIIGDSTRLAQLLDNLVSNAIKFTPEGGRVGVRLELENGHVLLAVSDTGMGISADEQTKLFQRFYRTAGATQRAIQGTGLGLTITKAIAEAHGGSISVESAEGEGTTFLVELPASDSAGTGGSSASAPAPMDGA
jgi:PAS domain S-box-containing protein